MKTGIARKDFGDSTIFTIYGSIEDERLESELLRRVLYPLIEERRNKVVLNLKNTSFLSYTALGILVERTQAYIRGGGNMFIAEANDYLKSIFRAAGHEKFFNFYEDKEQALEDLAA